MKIFITGFAGFIGSHLVDALSKQGHTVLGIDNLLTGKLTNVSRTKDLLASIGSITNHELMYNTFRHNPDVVIHTAASYADPLNWYRDADTNVFGTAMVVDLCQKFKIKRLIYFQTSLCYGIPQEQPITLNHPINPHNSYAITKTAGERFIAMSKLDYISFRLSNIYGPRNLSGPIPTFYKRLAAGEKCTVVDTRRDFVFVEDLVKIVMKAIDGVGDRGMYHVSTGTDYSISDLYDTVREAMGLPSQEVEMRKRASDDVPSILLDPSKTTKDFGIVPDTKLEDGIKKAVEWYKENGVTETYTHLKN